MTVGHGNLKVAKNFNNVIGETLFNIPLDNVCYYKHSHLLATTPRILYRFAYLVYTCHWASTTGCGHYWRRPALGWTSSWQREVAVGAVLPSTVTMRVPSDSGPLSRWSCKHKIVLWSILKR